MTPAVCRRTLRGGREAGEVTGDTVPAVCRLRAGRGRERLVASNAVYIAVSNAVSNAEAYFEPKAWFRAICAGEESVGFMMAYDDPGKAEYRLWRFTIAGECQRRGYGRMALGLVVEVARSRPGACELLTSCVPGDGGPRPLCRGLGFPATGEGDDGEEVLRLPLG
ncbi:MAG: GNAT family N-acetyltransferase [Actinomycetota bacterium]